MKQEPGGASAGRSGVPSDLRVTIELRPEGGLEVRLRSKVAVYYGDSLRAQIVSLAERSGLRHARIDVEDEGALPFTVAARVECALRRAGISWPESPGASPRRDHPPSPRDRLRRSRLYLPGGEPKYFVNARLHRPDAVILDLEDSVHPGEKDAARLLVREALRAVDFGDAEVMVRINQLPRGLADLEAVVPLLPDVILLPKTESAGEVAETAAALERGESQAGVDRPIRLMPILETALGVERAFEIASASPRNVALTLGIEDLTADLGVARTPEGAETLYARQRVVNAAKAAGIQAIDSVFADVADLDGLAAAARRSRGLGFEGMGCLHPRQIPVIHDAFTPTPAELDQALRIVAAFAEAEARGSGVVSLGSKMIDAPVVRRAERLVARAAERGALPEGARP